MTPDVVVELEAETLPSLLLGKTGNIETICGAICFSFYFSPLFILCPESMDDATHIQGGLFPS